MKGGGAIIFGLRRGAFKAINPLSTNEKIPTQIHAIHSRRRSQPVPGFAPAARCGRGGQRRLVRSGVIGNTLSGVIGDTYGRIPWKNVTPMEEIIRFVSLAQTDRFTITVLCEQSKISRTLPPASNKTHVGERLSRGINTGQESCPD